MPGVEPKRATDTREKSEQAIANADEDGIDFERQGSSGRIRLICLSLCCLLLAGFAFIQGHDIGASFSNDYDEGVYLSSARMLNQGYPLFTSVFSSQPPIFPGSLALCFRLFGESVETGRGMVLFFALVSLAAIAWIAWRLFGPLTAPFAITCLGLPVCFFQNARNCTAEMPSLAFALLAIGIVVSAAGERHLAWLAVGGACFALAVLSKLLVVPVLLPLLALGCTAPSFLQYRKRELTSWRQFGWRSILLRFLAFGMGGLAVGILVLERYDLSSVYDQVVRFHEASKKVYPLDLGRNFGMLQDFFLNSFGIVVSAVGGLVLLWSRNRLVCVWLCLWFVAACCFVLVHTPLFDRHLMLLSPPLALAASASLLWLAEGRGKLGLSFLAIYFAAFPLVSFNSRYNQLELSCLRSWRSLSRSFPVEQKQAISLIKAETKPEDFVVTDEQMQIFRAGRSISPSLCDTSFNRIQSGYLKGPEAIQAAEGARMIIFWTHRLDGVPGFRAWVESHYGLVKESAGKSVYSRKDVSPSAAPVEAP